MHDRPRDPVLRLRNRPRGLPALPGRARPPGAGRRGARGARGLPRRRQARRRRGHRPARSTGPGRRGMIEPLDPATAVETVPFVAVEVAATLAGVPRVRRMLVSFAAANGADAGTQAMVGLAASEAMTNAVVHGHRGGVPGFVHVAADVEDGALELVVCDRGHGIRAGTPSDGLGLGLVLIAEVTARFEIREQQPRGTEVWMRFLL